MSYTKTIWADGDVISANKMNNLETGVDSSAVTELNALGAALLGDSYTPIQGHNNAQTIKDIADAVTAAGGIGGGGSGRIFYLDPHNLEPIDTGLSVEDLLQCTFWIGVEQLVIGDAEVITGWAILRPIHIFDSSLNHDRSQLDMGAVIISDDNLTPVQLGYNVATGEITLQE